MEQKGGDNHGRGPLGAREEEEESPLFSAPLHGEPRGPPEGSPLPADMKPQELPCFPKPKVSI